MVKLYGLMPMLLLKMNKDYRKEETDNPNIVEFITEEGRYYVLTKNIHDCVKLRYEQIKRSPHRYERSGTIVEEGEVVVDLGAAEGAFSLTASKKAKKVYALEPHPVYATLLKKTFNGIKNVEVVEIAVSNFKGEGCITDGGYGSTLTTECLLAGHNIKIDTIDTLFENENIDYIKCDIEGEEVNMLKGAERVIKRDKPKIAICVYHDPSHPEIITKMLKEWVPEYKIKIVKNCVLHAYI